MYLPLFGLLHMIVGFLLFRHPDADPSRWFSRNHIDDLNEKDIINLKLKGLILVLWGALMALAGVYTLLKGHGQILFTFSLIVGLGAVSFGIYAIKQPNIKWMRSLGVKEQDHDITWFIKLAGIILIIFGTLCILLSAQHLFV
ncbi:hypothetical protein [Paenibacillus lemnae]|uniref:Uncharacterized protein n=1 Tax=Paenibacillus lemnae TaxID=1330551 RepID=A0A848M3C3_PAELE|nr:hypothetical protein [Paenibacillus lemnae]NMO94741.1 hypothetical protein [Paenibacillus lemnae]